LQYDEDKEPPFYEKIHNLENQVAALTKKACAKTKKNIIIICLNSIIGYETGF
jgi:hypothetical protein